MQSHLLQVVNWTVHCGRAEFATNIDLLNTIFRQFVESWSKHEEARKEREAEEQSLYRYRTTQTCGDGLNEDERDAQAIATHFPSFEQVSLGSDTRVRTQKKPGGFFGYTHLKNPPQKNPHFYFNLILVCTLYATNNAIFYCFKAFKALSY